MATKNLAGMAPRTPGATQHEKDAAAQKVIKSHPETSSAQQSDTKKRRKNSDGLKRVTVYLTPETYKKLKLQTVERDCSMSHLLETLLS